MSTRIQKTKKPKKLLEEIEEISPKGDSGSVKADLESVLDEIDSVLEQNAEEFVRAYVQKGGE